MSDHPDARAEITDELLPPQVHQLSLAKRVTFLSLGFACIALGVVLWLIPFVTGIPFWLIGVIFLARTSDRVRRAVNWCDVRLPHSARKGLRWARAKLGVAQLPAPESPAESAARKPDDPTGAPTPASPTAAHTPDV